ncbi:hypothetical protein E2493_02655 [Sphingomonas parva]|uniref:Uncharacterized protein n=1 Tax=Sphingomonas parva TaxID=2555898 RepID=A0A4Y8ZUR3_9SPHN|nr:hypothetical protein [Sphingomonas parva]TFI59758.1 hypothetical protein E2493_02655 [Sphingomonas parva]
MFTENGKRHVQAFLAAMNHVADPNRAIMADVRPCVLVTGGTPLDPHSLIALAKASDGIDADLIHLEFEIGAESEGPRNILTAMVRDGIVHVGPRCAVWVDPRGRPFLLRTSGKMGLISFDPDGLDFRPGRPKTSVGKGLARGTAKLRQLAAEQLGRIEAANDYAGVPADAAA